MAETNQCGGSQVDGKLLGTSPKSFPHRGCGGLRGFFPPSQMGGGILLKKDVFWGLTLFFYGNFQPKNDYSFRISTSEFQILEFSSAWVEGAGFVGLTLSVRKRNNDGWIRATNKKVRKGGVSEGISRSLILVVLLEKLISKKITTHAIPLANYAGNPIIACW